MKFYWYKDSENPYKLILAVNWFTFEDIWHQRYMFDRARYDVKTMERYRLKNLNRHRWFSIGLNLFNYTFHIEFKLKKVGWMYYGRLIEDVPKTSPLSRRRVKQK